MESKEPKVTQKPCTKCGVWKRVPEDYSMRKRKLKDGSVTLYPNPECKPCATARSKQARENYILKHGKEAWLKLHASYRDPEERKTYNREWWRMTHGKGKRTWRRYAPTREQVRVDAAPFLAWWDANRFRIPSDRGRWNTHHQTVRRIRNEGQTTIDLFIVDEIGTRIGEPGLAAELYPDV
jgi:hypothetical protein